MHRLHDGSFVYETNHRRDSALQFHRHGMSFATIVVEGRYAEVRDGSPQSFGPGSLVVHDAGEEHADYFLSDARCLNVELAGGAHTGMPVHMDAVLRQTVGLIVHTYHRDAARLPAAVTELQMLLENQRHPSISQPPEWLQHALEAFPWCEAVPLREAARLAGVHPVQFSRVFHRHVGVTANEYRRQSRLRRASELLLATSAPLVRVAQHCGFSDQSHLTRTFGEALGLSPALYRRIFAR